jgi:hypothetical protein
LDDALTGLQVKVPAIYRWYTILEIARREAKR